MENRLEIILVNPEDLEAFESIEEIQRQAWIGLNERDIVPTHFMVSIAAAGGQILLGRVDGIAVAFSLAIPTVSNWASKVLYSHMLAVRQEYQGRNIGQQIKLAQRDHALRAGFTGIEWTFSPMLTNNAFLNIAKLGAKCTEFYSNRYGCIQNGLYGSLATDRLKAEWDIGREHKVFRDEKIEDVVHCREFIPFIDNDLLAKAVENQFIACSVPSNFPAIMKDKPKLAVEWQRVFSVVAKHLLTPKVLWKITSITRPDNNLCRYIFERSHSCQ